MGNVIIGEECIMWMSRVWETYIIGKECIMWIPHVWETLLLVRSVFCGYHVCGNRTLLIGMYYVHIVCVGNVHYW